MSEKLCTLRTKGGGGGRYNETSLWTNPSPTSSFANQNVSLSDSVSNYKYIKIRYNYSSSYSTIEVSGIISVDDLKKTTAGNRRVTLGLGQATAGNSYYARYVNYVSDTSINISNVNGGSSGSTDIIPLEILGLNELDHGKRFDETTLWTNSAPTSNFAAQSASLSDNIDNYDYIGVKYKASKSDTIYSFEIYRPEDIKRSKWGDSAQHTELSISMQTSANALYTRYFQYYNNGDGIYFRDSYLGNNSGTNNAYNIPIEIVGCRFR